VVRPLVFTPDVDSAGSRDGAYYPPTVLTGVTPEMEAYREEFFGPVGVVYWAAHEDAAVTLANDTSFGLGSYRNREPAAAKSAEPRGRAFPTSTNNGSN
jgi:acyl-CoA reductase-like NAD-dependent aldehyde dehydrogenase